MISFEVAGKKYQAGTLDVFEQMIIAKRLMPVLKNIVTPEVIGLALSAKPVAEGEATENKGDEAPSAKLDAAAILPAIADAIYSLSDQDAKLITQTALKVVSRENTGGAYSPLLAPNGGLMFKDVGLSQMMQIAWKVIEGHLGDFFSTAQ